MLAGEQLAGCRVTASASPRAGRSSAESVMKRMYQFSGLRPRESILPFLIHSMTRHALVNSITAKLAAIQSRSGALDEG